MNLRQKVGASFLVYGTLAALVVVWSYAWTAPKGKIEDFIKLATLWMTILPGALTAWMSYLVLTSQQSAASELEIVKTKLASELETVKTKLAASLELTKARLGRIGKACDEMHTAALRYYYTLASLERGKRDAQLCEDADRAMIAAAGFAAALDDKLQSIWHEYWQYARRINEASASCASASALTDLWIKEVKGFGASLEKLTTALQRQLSCLPDTANAALAPK